MTVTQCTYGSYEHGKPYCNDGTWTWYRLDRYMSSTGGPPGYDLLFADGAADDSPIYSGPYDPACSCCYLNFPHTTAAHVRRAK